MRRLGQSSVANLPVILTTDPGQLGVMIVHMVRSTASTSAVMSRVRAKNTGPEMIVRRFLWAHGYRYRLHERLLPGRPDIVVSRYRTVIEVRGCFWHGHVGCDRFSWPKSSRAFWRNKILATRRRDRANRRLLIRNGWNVVEVWECELLQDPRGALKRVESRIRSSGRRS